MSFTLKTDDLPTPIRPTLVYNVTVASFELRTAQSSGQPNINVTLQGPNGKRFDRIFLKKHWFDEDFSPKNIHDESEQKLFVMSVGGTTRAGKVKLYLGADTDAEFSSPEELTAALNESAVGKRFIVKESQQRDEDGNVTDNYNLNIYNPDYVPKRGWPEGAVVMLDEAVAV